MLCAPLMTYIIIKCVLISYDFFFSFVLPPSLWLHSIFLPHPLLMLLFVCLCLFVCLLTPSVPLGHQPGSLLHQCHPFPCQSWCLHTKLPICTLPALCSPHGCCGPQDHAPAARRTPALHHPPWPLPAGPHRLPTYLPRWERHSCR